MMGDIMRSLSSRHHPLVAACRALARPGARNDHRILLDGPHLVTDALAADLSIETVAFTARASSAPEAARLIERLSMTPAELVQVTDSMMAAMSPVSSPSGIVAIAARPVSSLDRVLAAAPALVVSAVDVQEPGNVGAVVRAAEAGGATGAIFCGASADPFGWKALRGSMGSALRLPVASDLPLEHALAAARAAGLRVVATVPHGGEPPEAIDWREPTLLLFGGEGPGLSDDVLAAADARVSIPMRPPVESLNVAVAAALLVYEAARRRGSI
jgi:RNA methyltransferase, TrmH family